MLAAIASSSLGGLSVGVTRLVVGSTDPITLGAFRFGIGSVLLLPLVWRHRARWPNVLALAPIAGLGLLFFGLFPVLFNASLIYTTAARGSLALSTLPLLTMLVAAILQVETLTRAKTAGVVMATIGVAVALFTGLGLDASNAWRGDVLMVAAALCMAFYSVWSRALAKQYGAIAYTALHDIWRPRACSCGRDARWLRSDRGIRTYPVERCRISRYIRWCPHVPVVVVRLAANDADTGRHLGDSQPGCVRDLRGLCTGRADYGQSRTRSPARCHRDFGCILNAQRDDGPDVATRSERPTDTTEPGVLDFVTNVGGTLYTLSIEPAARL